MNIKTSLSLFITIFLFSVHPCAAGGSDSGESATPSYEISGSGQLVPDIPDSGSLADSATIFVDKTGSCSGKTPCYTSIQPAIDVATSADIVYVFPGTYIENVNLKNGVMLQGAGRDITVIQGLTADQPAVKCEGSMTTGDAYFKGIDGFTISGGYGLSVSICNNATISNNIVSGSSGAGIQIMFSSPVITNNIIVGNKGGISLYKGESLEISHNDIIENSGEPGVAISWGSAHISNNIIVGNNGGGIHLGSDHSGALIVNNTIVGNSANVGGGILIIAGAGAVISNNIISYNVAQSGGGLACDGVPTAPPGYANSDYNDFWNNSGGDVSGCVSGSHDISADPLFVDLENGNYRLKQGSPCIDAGDNSSVPQGETTDFYGDPRILSGKSNTAIVDIGAAEYVPQIIVDNGTAGTSSTSGTCGWTVSGAAGYYGTDSVYGCGGGTYTWHANLPQTGTYAVYVWWTQFSNRSTNAPYTITYNGGSQTFNVNQQTNGGRWIYLGTFSFSSSAGGTVKLSAPNGYPVTYSADAVKFVLNDTTNKPPSAFIDSIAPSPADVGQTVTFTGHGADSDGTIAAYEWTSTLVSGVLSTQASFSTSSLPAGTHTIWFRVQDNAGSWSTAVTQTLTITGPVSDVVIDNGATGISSTAGTCGWTVSSAAGAYGTNSVYGCGGGTYTWHANLPQNGAYAVYVWWTQFSNRTTSAPYTITYNGGSQTINVNQQTNGGKWNYLGTFSFSSSAGATVMLSAPNGYPVTYSADAVKFMYVPPSSDVIIDNGAPGTSSTPGTCSWTVSSAAGAYGINSLYGCGGGTYTWHADLPQPGNYDVYVWWTQYSNRSTSALYRVLYGNSLEDFSFNQQINGGKWNYLGIFNFTSTGGTVTLSAQDEYPVTYSADAVKFVFKP